MRNRIVKELERIAEVELDPKQQELKRKIKEILETIKGKFQNLHGYDDVEELENTLGVLAHELHMSLVPQPKHRRYMIENRGLEPEDPDFYKHIHPVEGLTGTVLLNHFSDFGKTGTS